MGSNDREILAQAVEEWTRCREDFNTCDPDFLDYHIYRLKAAEERLDLTIRQIKRAWGIPVHHSPINGAEPPTSAIPEPADGL